VKRVLALIPLSWLYVAAAVAAGTLRVVRWRRSLVDCHLARCLPELDPERRRRIGRAFYRYLGRFSAEIAHIPGLDNAELEERVRFENPELIARSLREGCRVLILSSHHCNWEWLLLRCSSGFGVPLTAAYKPLPRPRFDTAVRQVREKFGGTMIPTRDIVQHLLQQRGQVRLLALLADQSPTKSNPQQLWLDFFGQDTSFHSGPGWIGSKMDFHVVLANMRQHSRGHYSVTFVELAAPGTRPDPSELLQRYATEIERHVREFPEQYFWAYNRWKREKPLYG